jgi:hypothetical protein
MTLSLDREQAQLLALGWHYFITRSQNPARAATQTGRSTLFESILKHKVKSITVSIIRELGLTAILSTHHFTLAMASDQSPCTDNN